jgi:hypothetical protein
MAVSGEYQSVQGSGVRFIGGVGRRKIFSCMDSARAGAYILS